MAIVFRSVAHVVVQIVDRGKAAGKALSNFRQQGGATGSITGIVSLANAVPVLECHRNS